jgi:hypothetical protein
MAAMHEAGAENPRLKVACDGGERAPVSISLNTLGRKAAMATSHQSIQSLNGKVFAMLTEDELATFSEYVDHGRKLGVNVSLSGISEDELRREHRSDSGRAKLRETNCRVIVREETRS